MDDFFDLPTLIVIGLAIVILFRLRSVLGTRTGHERPPVDRRTPPPIDRKKDDTVVPLRPRQTEAAQPNVDNERRTRKLEAEIEQFSRSDGEIANGLRAVAEADQTFTPKSFLEGAKAAYEMVVTAFATGDRTTLKNLLEKDVFDGFARALADREAAGNKVDFTFVGLPRSDIVAAEYDKRQVMVTVRFDAEIVSATRNKDGALLEGNADQVQLISDEWTFARNPRSRDPNWKLVATNQIS